MVQYWPWLALLLLGAYHGINPGMGWLFAVALGLQEKSRAAVFQALPPIAIGHALSIGIVVTLAGLAQASLPPFALRVMASALLCGFGVYRLFRARHPSWVGMRVGFRDLVLWSFVMASAHGAGLMLLPILLGASHAVAVPVRPAAQPMRYMEQMGRMEHAMPSANRSASARTDAPMQHDHMAHMSHLLSAAQMKTFASPALWLAAVVVHTLGHLLVAGLVALVVYEKLGLAVLRQAWFNLDLVWTLALIISGVFMLLV